MQVYLLACRKHWRGWRNGKLLQIESHNDNALQKCRWTVSNCLEIAKPWTSQRLQKNGVKLSSLEVSPFFFFFFPRDMLPKQGSLVRVMEGATNNMPDAAAHQAAMQIHSLVQQLGRKDLVLTLISGVSQLALCSCNYCSCHWIHISENKTLPTWIGGGSALLPAPVPPVTLEDMALVTRTLSKGGATIQQLNTVRKQLELLKGGGLAAVAHPAQVGTFSVLFNWNSPFLARPEGETGYQGAALSHTSRRWFHSSCQM